MHLRSKLIFSVIFSYFVVAMVLLVSAPASFAEGDTKCDGRIIGSSKLTNVNSGQTHFDSHQGPGFEDNKVVSLAIVGLGEGLAPVSRTHAACAEETTAKATPLKDKLYDIKGYAWNDNLGFVSLFCGADGKNQGVGCGPNQYGVKISKADGAGIRKLSGYAWNSSFGYMQFSGKGAIPWDVEMKADGGLRGHAWTEAGVWVSFDGVKIKLPGQDVKAIAPDCGSKPFVCLEVKPDSGVVVADGKQGYELHLYLYDADGSTPMDLLKYDLSDMKFNWLDTLKLDQRAGKVWSESNAAVTGKPVSTSLSEFNQVEPGHYVYKYSVGSIAPTSSANISFTTASKPSVSIKNEQFLVPISNLKIEPSELVLKYLEFSLKTKADGKQVTFEGVPVDKAYPNNKDGFALNFKPAIEVDTLYANNQQDAIYMNRGIPVNIRSGVKINGKPSFSSEKVDVHLGYDKEAQKQSKECAAVEALKGFEMSFIRDISGKELSKDDGVQVVSGLTPTLLTGAGAVSGLTPTLLTGTDLQIVATLPESKDGKESPCTKVEGPTVYTVVSYTAQGKGVHYYSNKLPRSVSDVDNPAAVAHGNVYAQKAFSPSSGVQAVQEIRTKGVNTLRDSLYESIATKLGVKVDPKNKDPKGKCTVSSLKGEGGYEAKCSNGGKYNNYLIEGERALYFQNADVTLDLDGGKYTGRSAVIVENGNLFIDKDIYNAKASINDKVALVVLRPHSLGCGRGNIYIKNTVSNIQANILSDCSIYSYYAGQSIGGDGRPVWNDFPEMIGKLSKQLFIEGSISAAVTYGGGDSDELGYLRSPWEVVELDKADAKKRMEIQQSDLNYLRLFKLQLETSENGLPIDQSCGKALTFEDILAIQKWKEDPMSYDPVVGEGVDEFGDPAICDGIDSLNPFNPEDILAGGDLVPPKDKSLLSTGLNAKEDFDPVYIFYRPPNSFVFEK